MKTQRGTYPIKLWYADVEVITNSEINVSEDGACMICITGLVDSYEVMIYTSMNG